jgi:hypothetical protein
MPEVELVETGANLGFAGGNNVGYAHARDRLGAAFIAVINNDTRIEQADFRGTDCYANCLYPWCRRTVGTRQQQTANHIGYCPQSCQFRNFCP